MSKNQYDFMEKYINSKYEYQVANIDLFIETYKKKKKKLGGYADVYYEELIPILKYEILKKSTTDKELFMNFLYNSEFNVKLFAIKEIKIVLKQLLNDNDISNFRKLWRDLDNRIKIESSEIASQALKIIINLPTTELKDIMELWHYVDEKDQKELFTLVSKRIKENAEITIDKIIDLFNSVSKEIQNENKEVFKSFFTKKECVDKLKFEYVLGWSLKRDYIENKNIKNMDQSLIMELFDNHEVNIKVKIKIYDMLREISQFREDNFSIFENIMTELLRGNIDIEIINAWKSIQNQNIKKRASQYAEKIVDRILSNSKLNVDFITLVDICSITSIEYQNKNLDALKTIFVKSANESYLQGYFGIRNIHIDILEEVLKDKNIELDKRIIVWNNVNYELKAFKSATFEILLDELLQEPNANLEKIIRFWTSAGQEKTEKSIESFLERIINEKEAEIDIIDYCWRHLEEETQNKHPEWFKTILNRYFDTKKAYNIKYEMELWSETSKKVQEENSEMFFIIFENARECDYELPKGIIEKFWKNTATEIQIKNDQAFSQLLEDFIINNNSDYNLNYKEFWKNTCIELQGKHIGIIDVITDSRINNGTEVVKWMDILKDILKNTDESILYENKERIISIVRENTSIWGIIPPKIKDEVFIQFKNEIFKDMETDEQAVLKLEDLWLYATKDTQNIYFDEIKEKIQNYNKIWFFISFWVNTKHEIQEKHPEVFKSLIETIKEKGDEVESYLDYIISNTSNVIIANYFKNELLDDDNQLVILCWKYLNKDNKEVLFNKAYRIINGVEPDQEVLDKMKYLNKKNKNIYQTIDLEFVFKIGKYLTKEQLIKITAYKYEQTIMQEFASNKAVFKAILYILDNDENWTLSLNRLIYNIRGYRSLIEDIGKKDYDDINNDTIIQNLVTVLSDKENYFEIKDYDDLKNYTNIKNKICIDILNGNIDSIPSELKKYSMDELYKFALLEYKFGICLDDAENILIRYGKDTEELPDGILKDYLKLLKEIVYCDEIENII